MTKLETGEWAYVPKPAAPPAIPAPSTAYPAAPNQYLRAPLPASMWEQPDGQRQFHASAIPQTRIAPLPANSDPIIGAQAASQAIQVVASTPATPSTTAADVDIVSAVNSILTGSLDVSSFTHGFSNGVGTTNSFNSVTPGTVGEVIISYRMNSNTSPPVFTPFPPWTSLSLAGGAIGTVAWQKATSTSPVSDTYVVAGTQAWAMGMIGLASNATPVFTSLASTTAILPATTGSVTITAGVGILVFIEFASNSFFSPGPSVSDSLGNVYVPVGYASGIRSGGQQAQISIFYCANPLGGAGATISLGGNSTGVSTTFSIFQVTGLVANTALYTFLQSDTTKLVQFRGSVNVSATLPNPALAAGWQTIASNNGSGTVTISTAGPTLNQSSSSLVLPPGTFTWLFSDGTSYWSTAAIVLPALASPVAHKFLTSYDPLSGAFTLGQPSLTDLTNGSTGTGTTIVLQNSPTLTGVVNLPTVTLAGTVSNYNGVATVSNGVPAEYATVDLTGKVAAISATTLYTPNATALFRVSAYLKITTAGTSPVLGPVTITYTDGSDSVAQSVVMAMQTEAGANATSNSGNTTTSVLTGSLNIFAKTGVAIQYAVAFSGTIGTGVYEVHLKCEQL